ncbi:MAG: Efflux transporter, RND family, MFP subunit [Candidatus Jorgensenbacteria bacterium GW2011_GWA1_48_11]|uniref:Efflux transporter, RND family, MFP subunit n=1 Tax=Candidatus Jorgensenbacteria bacterium GW2011_GWA1_48_11 TaxID=1618660 RepID=A0A0G1WN65_9BACT|nr:MAG: Efflux transporter, RND family, MFP subunit [Candidatus Jorgensenbacteria bacterium GW2011_GWA1_48_11]KKW12284.1 MAG: Efflux transporter, RND family, MFP subunit [Candidatus Jorgensenbacteria bacterium GW2011_GWB1_49_9]
MNFLKRKWFIVAGLVLIVVLGGYFLFSGKDKSAFQTVTVVRGDVSEEVSVTGQVEPIKSVDLAFEQSGRIAGVYAEVGDKVYAGEALVTLDKSALAAQLAKAEADLATQEADLNKDNVDLANYYGVIPNLLNDAYAKADDATRKQLDGLFNNDESRNPTLTFVVADIAVDNDVRGLRLNATGILNQWAGELKGISGVSVPADLRVELDKAEGYLLTIRSLLSRSMDAVVGAASGGSLSSSTADAYKANINTARTNVNAALSDLTAQSQSIAAQEATIASVRAGVKSYEASIDNIKAQMAKMTIHSPINGVVTVENAKVGEIAAANTAMVSVISGSKFEVEANVAEADIAKVKVGDSAQITLDAYGNDVIFDAAVSSIDPGETMIEGVATYRTKFQFVKSDDRVKSGMTANIDIFTNKKENVLVIPQRAVTTKNGIRSVTVDLGKGFSEERQIEIGLRGADGSVEVLGGLQEGDKVIVNNS